MWREDRLRDVLRLLATGQAPEALALCSEAATAAEMGASGERVFLLSLRSLCESWCRQFRDGAETARLAIELAGEQHLIELAGEEHPADSSHSDGELPAGSDDASDLLLARAAAIFASCGWPAETATAPQQSATLELLGRALVEAADVLRQAPGMVAQFACHLLIEACVDRGQLIRAAQLVELVGPVDRSFLDGEGSPAGRHPFLTILLVSRAKLFAFSGRIDEAAEITLEALDRAECDEMRSYAESTLCLVTGNAQPHPVLRLVSQRLGHGHPQPVDVISTACYLLAAYGFDARGDRAEAARLVVASSGGDDGLPDLMIIDRVIGWEILATAAAGVGDQAGCAEITLRSEAYAGHLIVRPAVARMRSRALLSRGLAAEAAEEAAESMESARRDGRVIEEAVGEVVFVHTLKELAHSADAVAVLRHLSQQGDGTGYLSPGRWARRELRSMGLRMPPKTGSGWSGLSDREQAVALLIAEGCTNLEIATRLHVSPHTVQAHVSRVLAAYGVDSRLAVAALLSSPGEPEGAQAVALMPRLTARQSTVSDLIAQGYGNDRIATLLGVSVKTVEKHVGDILKRWRLLSRVHIARAVLGQPIKEPGRSTGPAESGRSEEASTEE